ncbi:hypothetical protein [Streptomyces sp. NBC_00459]|uniref:hypothetical protein n=1 Tax=Streptomyces sp. NBC_00459 TaxID=2975749 RepID=UPI002E18FE7C
MASDEETVCEAVGYAFSDNPAEGGAVGVDGAVLSVVMRHQDIGSLPGQAPGVTPSGRLALKTLTKRDRMNGTRLPTLIRDADVVASGPATPADLPHLKILIPSADQPLGVSRRSGKTAGASKAGLRRGGVWWSMA